SRYKFGRMTSRRSSLDASAAHAGGFFLDDTPTEEVDRREAVLESLAGTVRDLVDAAIRTTVEDEEVLRVRDDLAAPVASLRAAQVLRPAWVTFNAHRRSWYWVHAVVGASNGFDPPLRVVHVPDGCHADVRLGAAYGGPPGLVYGGVSAMLLDHIMGET